MVITCLSLIFSTSRKLVNSIMKILLNKNKHSNVSKRYSAVLFPPRWQFASDGADIGFGVYRRTKDGRSQKVAEMMQVLPSERYNAHLVPEDSCLTCNEPGVCE
ncbi:hypothetical protein CHARACLAT_002328 [Characodon lateralis]|uniref:Uncharacterized protein n=1 Tax=Characodon lateralis TaxID=208331 RepID=A0ABU7D3G5_9TELE|nr:hypothetical protein [Characodon lateralis]